MFLMQLVFMMIEFIHAYRLFELETWNVHHQGCVDFVRPFRQQLLESETAYCGICHKNCTSVVDFVLHHEWAHLCLPLFVCLVCHFTYITQSCLQMHITEFHRGLWAQLNNLFLSIIISKIRLLLYDSTDVTLCTTIFYL